MSASPNANGATSSTGPADPHDTDDRGRADENEDERAEQLGRIPLPLFHSDHLRSPYVVDGRVFADRARSPATLPASMASSGGASAWQIATASASAAWLGVGTSSSAEDRLHHLPHLLLVGAAVAADRLLDPSRRVLSARDADGRRGDEHGSPRLPDGECDAGVCADVRLFQRDRIRGVQGDQLLDAREDREQACFRPLLCGRSPPPVARGPEAPAAFVDDSVPACSRPWVDAEDLHEDTLGVRLGCSYAPATASRTRSGMSKFA